MNKVDLEDMKKISGGANAILITGIVAAIITFVTGALYGYSNPKKCN